MGMLKGLKEWLFGKGEEKELKEEPETIYRMEEVMKVPDERIESDIESGLTSKKSAKTGGKMAKKKAKKTAKKKTAKKAKSKKKKRR